MTTLSNVIFVLAAALLAGCAGAPRVSSAIGYPSVTAAIEDLRAKPGVTLRDEAGWTVATDTGANTIWTFTPQGHPAHPAVAKRTVIEKGGALYVDLNVLCEGAKAVCDALVEDFQRLNQRAADAMQRSLSR